MKANPLEIVEEAEEKFEISMDLGTINSEEKGFIEMNQENT